MSDGNSDASTGHRHEHQHGHSHGDSSSIVSHDPHGSDTGRKCSKALQRKKWKMIMAIAIGLAFFVAELVIGFRTGSLAVVADAFHYINDVFGYVVALVAIILASPDRKAPGGFSYGWERAELLGAFFNGAFLMALGLSIFLQAIERFTKVEEVDDPKMVMIIGAVGFVLNVVVLVCIGHQHHGHSHEEDHAIGLHTPGGQDYAADHLDHSHMNRPPKKEHHHDLGMASVLAHVMGDAINNIGVVISGAVIWKVESPYRFYVDPAISVAIAVMIFVSAIKVTHASGRMLLQAAPPSIDLEGIRKDLERIPGVKSIHQLRVWSLNERERIASVHAVVLDTTTVEFMLRLKTFGECLHASGIHTYTIQPEFYSEKDSGSEEGPLGPQIFVSDDQMALEPFGEAVAAVAGDPDMTKEVQAPVIRGSTERITVERDRCANQCEIRACGRKSEA